MYLLVGRTTAALRRIEGYNNSQTRQEREASRRIVRELFVGVKAEKLVSEDWVECEEVNVLSWEPKCPVG